MSIQSRRAFLKALGVAVASGGMGGSLKRSLGMARPVTNDRAPNVLLIMTDDQGWGDIHSHGNDQIDTPVLDKLATKGARFDRFFVSPVCAPTRASLLTGRYHLRTGTHGVTRAYETMRSEEVTLADAFKQAGYATGCFGKWHNGAHYPHHPNGRGFDEFLGFCAGHWNNYFDTTLERNGEPVKTKGYITDVLTNTALEFIRKNRRRPFFCYIPYNAPHGPFQVPDTYFDKYKARGLDDQLACIYGMCENIDDNVARLLSCLDELSLADDTIVLFLTDNGANSDRYDGEMKGRKGSLDEGGVRVPLFVRWPGHIKPGTRVSRIAAHIDVFPTLMKLCGLAMPETLPQDGMSLVPLLTGHTETWPDRMLFTFRSPAGNTGTLRGSVRTARWRAVKGSKRWALYDMAQDPGQQADVAKTYPQVVKELSGGFDRMASDVTKAGFDPIATHVGYRDWPVVTLPGHEAFLEPAPRQGIGYVGRSGWANDWITNWTDTDAYAWWPLRVVEGGRFEVTLMVVCPKDNVGARLRVEVGGATLEGTVQTAHDPIPLPSPDRVARGEVYEKIWAPLTLGTMLLDKGPARLVVRALEIPGAQACDIKAVKLRRIE